MRNISLEGEDIRLYSGIYYFVIDALYLSQIRDELIVNSRFNVENFLQLFPYTIAPAGKLFLNGPKAAITNFKIEWIKGSTEDAVSERSFSTDSGVIVLVNESIFSQFLSKFDYNKLTDDSVDLINFRYWDSLCDGFEFYSCGLIISPGVNSNFEFKGSGLYTIEI